MATDRYEFGSFVFDARRKVLLRRGTSVAVGQKGLVLLEALLVADGRAVSKSDLMKAAWPGLAVEESNLAVQIAALRKCLGTTPEGDEWITTVQRVGYQLPRSATTVEPEQPFALRDAKPAVAVLPFQNMSSDPEQEYFADGLAEDLITDLSKVPGLMVIASHSSFAYKGRSFDIRQLSSELGARYVVEGNVRRAADRVRINAKLVDAAANSHVWADRFEGGLHDIFALQDEVVAKIVAALAGVLPGVAAPHSERPTSLKAYDLFVRGRLLVPQAPDLNLEGRRLLEAATALEPGFADAHAWLAASYHFRWAYWNESMESLRPLARVSANHAVALDPRNAVAHGILGTVLLYERDYEGSRAALDTALAINPSNADAILFKADLSLMEGQIEAGLAGTEAALRLNPNPPAYYHWFKGFTLYAAQHYAEAVVELRRITQQLSGSRRILAASLAQLGRYDEAATEAAAFMAANPNFRISYWVETQPFQRPADRQHFIDGYSKAGLPD